MWHRLNNLLKPDHKLHHCPYKQSTCISNSLQSAFLYISTGGERGVVESILTEAVYPFAQMGMAALSHPDVQDKMME